MNSEMLIDNKAVQFSLIMPMIQFRGCMYTNGVTNRDVKEMWQNNWQMLQNAERSREDLKLWRPDWYEKVDIVDKDLTSQLNETMDSDILKSLHYGSAI